MHCKRFKGFTGPVPARTTRFRAIGPKEVNGMNVWTVHEILGIDKETGKLILGEEIGPYCFSVHEAQKRCEDLARGKKVVWMGYTQFKQSCDV